MARSRTAPLPLKQDAKARLREILEQENYDPLQEVLKILKNGKAEITDQQRLQGALELLQYRYPKLKAIEVDGKIATDFQITIQKFGHLIAGPAETPALVLGADPSPSDSNLPQRPKQLETKLEASPIDTGTPSDVQL